jgi:hypothetical protein
MALNRTRRLVKRYSNGQYVDGVYTTLGELETFYIYANCQPASERDLEALPEGRRNNDSYVLFTDTLLRTAEVTGPNNPDIVELFGEDFEVLGVGRWLNGLLSHYRIFVSKKVQ